MTELRPCLFHGNKMKFRRLKFTDREGISFSENLDGLPYIVTTVGREFFEPGDALVCTEDMEVQRIYKAKDFDPFFKEVEIADAIPEKVEHDGGPTGSGVQRETGAAGGDESGSVRVADDEVEVVGTTKNTGGRSSSQRRPRHSKGNASKPQSRTKASRKNHIQHRVRKTRGLTTPE